MFKVFTDDEFEVRNGLNRLLDEPTLPEENLVILAEESGIDLGAKHKPRLNYLASLGILQKPKPVQFGKGRGGTRIFQRDSLDILEFVNEQREHFALNELGDLFVERRNDLVKKACRELNIASLGIDQDRIKNAARTDANVKCLFLYPLIKASTLSIKLGVLHESLTQLENEIAALRSCHNNLKTVICGDCEPHFSQYITSREAELKDKMTMMKRDLETGKKILSEFEE